MIQTNFKTNYAVETYEAPEKHYRHSSDIVDSNHIVDNSVLQEQEVYLLHHMINDKDRVVLEAYLAFYPQRPTSEQIATMTGKPAATIRKWRERIIQRWRQLRAERDQPANKDAAYKEVVNIQNEQKRKALQVQLDRIAGRDGKLADVSVVQPKRKRGEHGALSRYDQNAVDHLLGLFDEPEVDAVLGPAKPQNLPMKSRIKATERFITWDPSKRPVGSPDEDALFELKDEYKPKPVAPVSVQVTTSISSGYRYPLNAEYNQLDSNAKKSTEVPLSTWLIKPTSKMTKDEVSDAMARGFIKKRTTSKGRPLAQGDLVAGADIEEGIKADARERDPRAVSFRDRSVDGD